MQLNKDMIVDAAVTICNQYGMADMTMRRLAKELSVAPGALYWHIPNKQELIVEVANRIITPVLGQAARNDTGTKTDATHEKTAELCHKLTEEILNFRDGAEIMATALANPASTLQEKLVAEVEASISSRPTPLTRTTAWTLLHVVLGMTMHMQTEEQYRKFAESETVETISKETIYSAISLVLAGLDSQ